MKLIKELKRRNVIRMAGLYLVGAWLVVQVAGTILPMFGAPEWVARTVVILLAIGFVPALGISWVFELTPEGLKRDSEVTNAESIAPQTARRMDRLIIVVLLLALGYFAVDKFVLAPTRDASSTPQANASPETAASSAAAASDAKSIAVLAFADLSQTKDQEHFSDGVAEEILNALAKINDLKVAGRTASFYFKGRNEDLRTIGDTISSAQRAMGERQALAKTLAHWRKRLDFQREQGYASGAFVMTEARYFALADGRAAAVKALAQAIDLGLRDPLLARDPAFTGLLDDPDFKAQNDRMITLINIERAKLNMAPLP